MSVQNQFLPRVEKETAAPARCDNQAGIIVDTDYRGAYPALVVPDRDSLSVQKGLPPEFIKKKTIAEIFVE